MLNLVKIHAYWVLGAKWGKAAIVSMLQLMVCMVMKHHNMPLLLLLCIGTTHHRTCCTCSLLLRFAVDDFVMCK